MDPKEQVLYPIWHSIFGNPGSKSRDFEHRRRRRKKPLYNNNNIWICVSKNRQGWDY
jgi:hypothetical protein